MRLVLLDRFLLLLEGVSILLVCLGLGALLGLDPNAAVDLGNRMGAWVASDRAATPRLPDDLVNFAKELVCLRHAGQGDSLVETA